MSPPASDVVAIVHSMIAERGFDVGWADPAAEMGLVVFEIDGRELNMDPARLRETSALGRGLLMMLMLEGSERTRSTLA